MKQAFRTRLRALLRGFRIPLGSRQSLADSETRLQLAMRATGLGLWDFRADCEQVGSNDEIARLLGYQPGDFAETRSAFVSRLHPDDRDRVRRRWRDYLDGRCADYAVDFRMRTREGVYRWFRSVGEIVERDAEGRAARVVGTYLDIDTQVTAMARLTELSVRLMSVQETERARLARELHDELGQRLTALKLNVHAIGRDPDGVETAARVADCLALIDDTLARVRERALDLRPAVLDELGLGAALEWYGRRQEERAGVCILLEVGDGLTGLRGDLATTLFRVAQEAVSNALRHGGGDTVRITLERAPDGLRLVVEDNGRGFAAGFDPAAAPAQGFGMLAMRERVELVGGRFAVSAGTQGGVRVEAHLPLTDPLPTGAE